MTNESITVCHVPTGERFEFSFSEPKCDCRKSPAIFLGLLDFDLEKIECIGKFNYQTKTYHVSCPACGKELAVYEALKNGT